MHFISRKSSSLCLFNIFGLFLWTFWAIIALALNLIATIMAITWGPPWWRWILLVEPIRTPCGNATPNNWCTCPNSLIHHTHTQFFTQSQWNENYLSAKDENDTTLMTANCHSLSHVIGAVETNLYFASSIHFSTHLVSFSFFLPFYCIWRGGWVIYTWAGAWIDFCPAHFSWFWLRQL